LKNSSSKHKLIIKNCISQDRDKNKKSDDAWIRTVLQTGTINDKITANCLQVSDSAVHNLGFVDNLIASVKLSKKRECMLSIDALKNLFISSLLHKRPLRSFHQVNSLGNLKILKHLLVIYVKNFTKSIRLSSWTDLTATRL
jgi:hypothetical protein